MTSNEIRVEVAFALPAVQVLEKVSLPPGATVAEAIAAAGLAARFPDEQVCALPTGIWGLPADRDQPLRDGDRVEVYRPLEMDPRDARRRRARHGKTMRDRGNA